MTGEDDVQPARRTQHILVVIGLRLAALRLGGLGFGRAPCGGFGVLAFAALGVGTLGPFGCGPELPASWPAQSAASPDAEPAPAAVVTRAASEHPPLPGEGSGWAGLDAASSGAPGPETHDHSGHAAAVYSCPMHPDVVSDRPGQCPRCGMALVKRDAAK